RSHLRFGPKPIKSPYLIRKANFIACHQAVFLEKIDMLKDLKQNGIFLVNTPFSINKFWDNLPDKVQQQIIEKEAKVFIIDAQKVAEESGMGRRINTVMQTCFFAISGVLPKEKAIDAIKDSIRKTYGRKGEVIVQMNINAVDNTVAHLHEIEVPQKVSSDVHMAAAVPDYAPDFVKKVLGPIIAGHGDDLPVSAFPCDGTFPTATAQYEK